MSLWLFGRARHGNVTHTPCAPPTNKPMCYADNAVLCCLNLCETAKSKYVRCCCWHYVGVDDKQPSFGCPKASTGVVLHGRKSGIISATKKKKGTKKKNKTKKTE